MRNDRSKTKLIAVEGLDGSGKTLQTSMLKEYIESLGRSVTVIDFPQYKDFFGREIGKLLAGTDEKVTAMNLDPKSMCLWYALDRFRTVGGCDLQAYDYVLFNRYTLSNVVYQTARQFSGYQKEFADWVFALEHEQLGLPRPDLYVYLDIDIAESEKNNTKKDTREYIDGLDVYESSGSLLSRCRKIYLALGDVMPSMRVIRCMDDAKNLLPPDVIQQKIREVIGL